MLDKIILISGGFLCVIILTFLAKYLWCFEGFNYTKKAIFKDLSVGDIDDVTNSHKGS